MIKKRFAPLFPGLPKEEVERRIASDPIIAKYKKLHGQADVRVESLWKGFSDRMEKLRLKFVESRQVLLAVELRQNHAARIKIREAEIASKVSRECYIKQNQDLAGRGEHVVDHGKRGKHWAQKREGALGEHMKKMRDAKSTNTTIPPNETDQGSSNGLLESPNLDGARPENHVNEVQQP